MSIHFSIADSSEFGQRTVLTVCGALDRAAARDLERRLASLSKDSRAVVLDLSGVSEVSEACAELVASASRRLGEHRRSLRVIARDSHVAEAFASVGLTDVVQPDRRYRVRA
jgi:anti-anti-sigma regulatory factor